MSFEWYEILFLSIYVCLIAILIVLKLCRIGSRRRGVAKMLTSFSFVGVACYGMIQRGGLSALLFVGVCFASLGDLLLIFRHIRALFVCSVLSFSTASVLISTYSVLKYGWYWYSVIVLVLFMLFVILGQRYKLFGFGRNKVVLNIYTFAVGICGSLGFSLLIPYVSATQFLFGIGCFLYLVSDVLLGLYLYKFRNRFVDAANTLMYFPGMLFIALSLVVV